MCLWQVTLPSLVCPVQGSIASCSMQRLQTRRSRPHRAWQSEFELAGPQKCGCGCACECERAACGRGAECFRTVGQFGPSTTVTISSRAAARVTSEKDGPRSNAWPLSLLKSGGCKVSVRGPPLKPRCPPGTSEALPDMRLHATIILHRRPALERVLRSCVTPLSALACGFVACAGLGISIDV